MRSLRSGSTSIRRVQHRLLVGDLRHQLVDVLQLLQRRPAFVALAPVRTRRQPDRKGLGEILVRMALRVPEPKMLDEIPTRRIRPIIARIAGRRAAEQLLPAAAAVQLVGVLHHVPGLVPEDAHAFRARAAFDVDDHLALEPHQARMRQIEREGDAGRVLRAEPLARNPGVRPDPEAALLQLVVELAQAVRQPGAAKRELEVLQPQLQQPLVRPGGPTVLSAPSFAACYAAWLAKSWRPKPWQLKCWRCVIVASIQRPASARTLPNADSRPAQAGSCLQAGKGQRPYRTSPLYWPDTATHAEGRRPERPFPRPPARGHPRPRPGASGPRPQAVT